MHIVDSHAGAGILSIYILTIPVSQKKTGYLRYLEQLHKNRSVVNDSWQRGSSLISLLIADENFDPG